MKKIVKNRLTLQTETVRALDTRKLERVQGMRGTTVVGTDSCGTALCNGSVNTNC